MHSYRWIVFAGVLTTASGCAQIDSVKPGTSLSSVEKQFGTPTTLCPAADGTKRAVWSQQPFGEFAFATTIGADSRVSGFEQVLSDKSFNQLESGVWTPERVRCTFGPPENISAVGLPGLIRTVWSYRYRQNGVWYSLMYVFFDKDTNTVNQFFAGPDPMFEYSDFRFD
jgi:hypothetical protein